MKDEDEGGAGCASAVPSQPPLLMKMKDILVRLGTVPDLTTAFCRRRFAFLLSASRPSSLTAP
jgi:hypothetical protein